MQVEYREGQAQIRNPPVAPVLKTDPETQGLGMDPKQRLDTLKVPLQRSISSLLS